MTEEETFFRDRIKTLKNHIDNINFIHKKQIDNMKNCVNCESLILDEVDRFMCKKRGYVFTNVAKMRQPCYEWEFKDGN